MNDFSRRRPPWWIRWNPWRCRCKRRRWTPTTDPWLYVRAAWQLTTLPVAVCANIMAAIKMALDHGDDPGEAAFQVVADSLLEENP